MTMRGTQSIVEKLVESQENGGEPKKNTTQTERRGNGLDKANLSSSLFCTGRHNTTESVKRAYIWIYIFFLLKQIFTFSLAHTLYLGSVFIALARGCSYPYLNRVPLKCKLSTPIDRLFEFEQEKKKNPFPFAHISFRIDKRRRSKTTIIQRIFVIVVVIAFAIYTERVQSEKIPIRQIVYKF